MCFYAVRYACNESFSVDRIVFSPKRQINSIHTKQIKDLHITIVSGAFLLAATAYLSKDRLRSPYATILSFWWGLVHQPQIKSMLSLRLRRYTYGSIFCPFPPVYLFTLFTDNLIIYSQTLSFLILGCKKNKT